MIQVNFDNNKKCSFGLFAEDTIFKEIVSVEIKKATHSNIPTKIIRGNADLFSFFVSNGYKKTVTTFLFLSSLKLPVVTPAHKKIKA